MGLFLRGKHPVFAFIERWWTCPNIIGIGLVETHLAYVIYFNVAPLALFSCQGPL